MRILVAGIPSSPFEHEYRIHYSIFKSYGAAIGFSQLGHEVFFMSKNTNEVKDGVRLVSCSKIDVDFIKTIDVVIFGLETGVQKSIAASSGLIWVEEQKLKGVTKGIPIFVIKMGKHTWMEKSKWGYANSYKLFDFFFSQEPAFANLFKSQKNAPINKIFHSKMGLFESMPVKSDHSPFKPAKYNLLYMGRMRQHPSKMPFMMEMMDRLGDQYHLNILPGTFSKPSHLIDKLNSKGENKFGSEVPENYEWLVSYFKECKGITIHKPVQWGEHWQYLYHSDLGIDFSPHGGHSKYAAGNAKLLEYMAAGLPAVTESSVGNSEIVTHVSGGVLVSQIGDMDAYCSSIKDAARRKFNRDEISKLTIKNNSWKVRATEMIKDMGL